MRKINIRTNSIHGFQDAYANTSWRISHARYDARTNDIATFGILEKHLETEEAFLLLEGNAFLVTAGKENIPSPPLVTPFTKGEVLLVEKAEWHVCIHTPGSHILIIENGKESKSEQSVIDASMRKAIVRRVS